VEQDDQKPRRFRSLTRGGAQRAKAGRLLGAELARAELGAEELPGDATELQHRSPAELVKPATAQQRAARMVAQFGFAQPKRTTTATTTEEAAKVEGAKPKRARTKRERRDQRRRVKAGDT